MEAPADYLDRLPSIEQDLATIPIGRPPLILVAHTPPYGVLDVDTQGQHAGSAAVYDWIVQRQPLLTLHGHIHEAPEHTGQWTARIGATICVNPGPTTATDLRVVVIDTADLSQFWHTRYSAYIDRNFVS